MVLLRRAPAVGTHYSHWNNRTSDQCTERQYQGEEALQPQPSQRQGNSNGGSVLEICKCGEHHMTGTGRSITIYATRRKISSSATPKQHRGFSLALSLASLGETTWLCPKQAVSGHWSTAPAPPISIPMSRGSNGPSWMQSESRTSACIMQLMTEVSWEQFPSSISILKILLVV